MNAIDLYSGIGGWRIGLQAAGIHTVRSYEWWPKACDTQLLNFGELPECIDIRSLTAKDLPTPGSIDFLVGSPPCTQFSFANRGGSGDLADGLKDIEAFLKVVDFLKPRRWAMENVPRVAQILRNELEPGGSLSQYSHLVKHIVVVNAADFGLPQARKRMIAGNFNLELLESYKSVCNTKTLGEVLGPISRDVNWGGKLQNSRITDDVKESPLSTEEARMNFESKAHNAVYNKMSFPDSTNRPARTVTATCTRVSRESIVVGEPNQIRRLTVRERATLQGFPVSYQFKKCTYNDRLKQIGNAVPPVLTYFIAHAMMGTPLDKIKKTEEANYVFRPYHSGDSAEPDSNLRSFPLSRSFRYAIPGLRFHSGVRFELCNEISGLDTKWQVRFFYGNSKNIIRGDLSHCRIQSMIEDHSLESLIPIAMLEIASWPTDFSNNGSELQSRWVGRSQGPGPFEVIDWIAERVLALESQLMEMDETKLQGCVNALFPDANSGKMSKHWLRILSGTLIAVVVNLKFGSDFKVKSSRQDRQLQLALERKQMQRIPSIECLVSDELLASYNLNSI